MGELKLWEILLLLVVSYVAVTSLVRLMRQRRDSMVSNVQQQIDRERLRRKRAGKKSEEEAA